MNKAKKRGTMRDVANVCREIVEYNKRMENADYLLDTMEKFARDSIAEGLSKRGMAYANSVIQYVARARGGDMGAAIQAMNHHHGLSSEKFRVEELLHRSEKSLFVWRGGVIECSPLQRKMLKIFSEDDAVDAGQFVAEVWREPYIEPRPNRYDQALRKLSVAVQAHGRRVRFGFNRGKVLMNKLL